MQCYYNFIRPHCALKFGKEIRTPAQQAGLEKRRLSFRDVFTPLMIICLVCLISVKICIRKQHLAKQVPCSGHHRLLHEGGFSAALNLQGELVFSRPDGRVLPEVWPVPPVGEDGQSSLVRANQSRGLEISHQTLPVWQGGHPDYGWAVEILLEADQAAGLSEHE